MTSPATLILGCGYLGERVGRLLVARGQSVFGTTRRPDRTAELRRIGIEPVLLDVARLDPAIKLPRVDRVLSCVGFDRRAGDSIHQVYVDGLQAVLTRLAVEKIDSPIVYASSTGVFGGDDGAWVDEATPPDPRTESGRACLAAELVLRRYAAGSITVRFAGLYGPGRIMRRDELCRGEPVIGNPDKYLNFIQIDDAAAVASAALDDARVGQHDLYLASDGNPIVRAQFYGLVAELIHAPPPRFEMPDPESPAARREESNKRISNRKLLNRWESILRYPDLRSGLAASLAGP